MTIECKYSCKACGLEKVALEVEARTVEDVRVWMEEVFIPALVEDHEKRSPGCLPEAFDEVFIPIEGVAQIGGSPTIH